MNYESHDFYCIQCGKRGLPLMRPAGHRHKKLHRKSLYCPFCKTVINCVEVATQEEKQWFLQEFEKGSFKEEALASLGYLKGV